MSDFYYQKAKMYYEKYKSGKLVKKVCSVIKDSDKYLVLIKDKKRAFLIGGSVEDGETTRQAIVREVLEECGGKVVKMQYLTKDYYSLDWEFEGITFPNKRVEYYYLCKIENDNLNVQGLEGEFDEKMSLKWCTIKELEDLQLNSFELELIKKTVNKKRDF